MSRELEMVEPHEEWLELCALATAGLLDSDERERLRAHLDHCLDCREAMSQFRMLGRNVIPLVADEYASRAFLVYLVGAVLIFSQPVKAASPEPGDPVYHSLRYNDDFSWLGHPIAKQRMDEVRHLLAAGIQCTQEKAKLRQLFIVRRVL